MNESPLTTEALQERLSGRPAKELTLAIAREAMTDAAVLDTLLFFIYEGGDPLRWRAAWVLEKVSEQQPSLLAAEHSRIVALAIRVDIPDGFRRLLLSILHNLPDAQELDVKFFNFLLNTMLDLKSPPGVQSLAMKLAHRMSRMHDELHEEFICIVRNMELDYYSAGVRSVVRHCMRKK
ncbi:MAG: hypothetical protein IKL03_04745 [Bacteroidaceae bacterium]|nr:hypothetical protein [Bacteroidaceae bacterium]